MTEIAWRFSPSCGLRKTTSCGPIGTLRLPIGVSPTRCPSIQTSAQGDAFRFTTPLGRSIAIGATLPGRDLDDARGAEAERFVDELELVTAGCHHHAVGIARPEHPAALADLDA